MNNLRKILSQPLQRVSNKTAIFTLVIALTGFADATYLAIEHFSGRLPPCTLIVGCDRVLTSPYSEIFGIPVALFGAVYYLIVMIGAFTYLESRNTIVFKWTLYLTVVGLLASLWFLAVQAFLIRAYCMYCLGSVVTSTVLFIIAAVILVNNHRNICQTVK